MEYSNSLKVNFVKKYAMFFPLNFKEINWETKI